MDVYVLVSTIGRRLAAVEQVLLPPQKGIHYVIVWQSTGLPKPEAEWLHRQDVTLDIQSGSGLARSRNRALELAVAATADNLADGIIIFADDDERIAPAAIAALRTLYSAYPRLDIALCRARRLETDVYLKSYPKQRTNYVRRPRSYYISSVEVTMRLRVCHVNLRFDERFGLGSNELCAGEEEVFLHDATRRGLLAIIEPIDLCSTPQDTTGSNVLAPLSLRSKGAVYGRCMSFPIALLRCLREALGLAVRHRCRMWPLMRELLYGLNYIRR